MHAASSTCSAYVLFLPTHHAVLLHSLLQICKVADRVGVGVYFNTLVPVDGQVSTHGGRGGTRGRQACAKHNIQCRHTFMQARHLETLCSS